MRQISRHTLNISKFALRQLLWGRRPKVKLKQQRRGPSTHYSWYGRQKQDSKNADRRGNFSTVRWYFTVSSFGQLSKRCMLWKRKRWAVIRKLFTMAYQKEPHCIRYFPYVAKAWCCFIVRWQDLADVAHNALLFKEGFHYLDLCDFKSALHVGTLNKHQNIRLHSVVKVKFTRCLCTIRFG